MYFFPSLCFSFCIYILKNNFYYFSGQVNLEPAYLFKTTHAVISDVLLPFDLTLVSKPRGNRKNTCYLQ